MIYILSDEIVVFLIFWSTLKYTVVIFVAFLLLGMITSIIFITHINIIEKIRKNCNKEDS